MKTYLKLLAIGLSALAMTMVTARAEVGISAGIQINAVADFDGPLAAEGTWVSVGDYGRCWHPRGVAVDWRPYCDGQWVSTDDGWYWQSDEPWAWACYHYGTWTMDPGYGWIWVPGVDWAPAWVVWRSGGGYVGWAPCAPQGVSVDVGLFAFVPTGHFDERISRGSVIFNNADAIHKTTLLSATTRGPDVAEIRKASGHEIKTVPLQEERSRTRVPVAISRQSPAPGERPVQLDERTPRNDGIAPSRDISPKPPLNQDPGRKEEVVPGREQSVPPRAIAPPADERLPRTDGVQPSRPVPGVDKTPQVRPPTTVAPQRERESAQPHPSEEQKPKEEKHDD
jgi:hypothetical protein